MTTRYFQVSSNSHWCNPSVDVAHSRNLTEAAGGSTFELAFEVAAGETRGWSFTTNLNGIGVLGDAWDGSYTGQVNVTELGGSSTWAMRVRRLANNCLSLKVGFMVDARTGTGIQQASVFVDLTGGIGGPNSDDRFQFEWHVTNGHMMNASVSAIEVGSEDTWVDAPWELDAPDTVLLSGTSETTSASSGDLFIPFRFQGTSEIASTGSGMLGVGKALGGTGATESGASGALSRDVAFSGTSDTVSGGSGFLSFSDSLSGESSTASSGSGNLSFSPTFSGISETASSSSGSLSPTRRISGTSAGATSSSSGDLQLDRWMLGTSDTETSGSGNIEALGAVPLSGTSETVTGGSGDLTTSRTINISGTSTTSSSASGDLSAEVSLSGLSRTTTQGRGNLLMEGEEPTVLFLYANAGRKYVFRFYDDHSLVGWYSLHGSWIYETEINA